MTRYPRVELKLRLLLKYSLKSQNHTNTPPQVITRIIYDLEGDLDDEEEALLGEDHDHELGFVVSHHNNTPAERLHLELHRLKLTYTEDEIFDVAVELSNPDDVPDEVRDDSGEARGQTKDETKEEEEEEKTYEEKSGQQQQQQQQQQHDVAVANIGKVGLKCATFECRFISLY